MTTTFKVVIAGCGSMANTWAEYAKGREDVEIVGLVDIQEKFAQAFADRHGLSCPIYTNITEALTSSEANIVFDVTIPASHYGISTVALKHGCHVFSEKPLAESMTECLDIVKLAESVGRTHAVMQNRRFDPRIRAFKDLIDSGAIGKPGFIGADFFLGAHFGGFRDLMDSPLLLDMAIHTFDQARMISGANPVSVYCQEFNPPGSWYAGNAMAICIYEMSDGSVFNYRGSWCAEGAQTSWEAAWRVTGEKGTAIWDGHDEIYAEFVAEGDQSGNFIRKYERTEGTLPVMEKTGHHGCLEHMFHALEAGVKPETDCSDNVYSMAMVLAALESAKTGQKVMISEFMKGTVE
ncbi:Gfo/Idh/MocA family oxidoreductase [Paenibacillus sp. p3-SID867]|uniref:Gfo/Idh/MocA family protein n=1 Tax=Paenibacillus sp. p3-SID867 TaxID=2916363 RepID=UPI0021A4275C|nr:Gfo/Idh/MocA family oxidoreductase [Paenibacillus sp. p3-SID867]MCT1399112.1 Gfo/Idh/MocA family oxidoreductase [Paenibacillus sp. p3-SID867]